MIPRPPALRPRASAAWLRHFEESAARIEPVPWDLGPWLDQPEREAVARSIQEFQLGESSEGRRFRAVAAAYAAQTGDPAYAVAIDRFIGEEQQHSRYLAQFLELEGIPLVRRTPVDGIFRRLRRLAGLETMLSVLITAEILAQVYYVALGRATRSPVLRSICRRILVDEAVHVRFQAERIARLRRRSRIGSAIARILHRCLAVGAGVVVWTGHGRVFERAGLGFAEYAAACRRAFRRGFRLMDPDRYDWSGLEAVREGRSLRVDAAAGPKITEAAAAGGEQPAARAEVEASSSRPSRQLSFRNE